MMRNLAIGIGCGGMLWAGLMASVHAGLLEPLKGDEEGWVEQAVEVLPPPPDEAAMEPFALEREARHRYYIDRRTVSVLQDGVVRFTLTVKPPEGRPQSSYVGLRCHTAEWKTYAVIGADGRWKSLPKPTWERIQSKARDSVRGDLYRHYFCAGTAAAGTPEDLLTRLRKPFRPPVR